MTWGREDITLTHFHVSEEMLCCVHVCVCVCVTVTMEKEYILAVKIQKITGEYFKNIW